MTTATDQDHLHASKETPGFGGGPDGDPVLVIGGVSGGGSEASKIDESIETFLKVQHHIVSELIGNDENYFRMDKIDDLIQHRFILHLQHHKIFILKRFKNILNGIDFVQK